MTLTLSAGFRLSHCGNNGAVPFLPKIKIELTFMALAIGGTRPRTCTHRQMQPKRHCVPLMPKTCFRESRIFCAGNTWFAVKRRKRFRGRRTGSFRSRRWKRRRVLVCFSNLFLQNRGWFCDPFGLQHWNSWCSKRDVRTCIGVLLRGGRPIDVNALGNR
jgi:hypothetical protein